MKILLVDDQADDRRLLRYIVERHGHETIEASDGQEGLEKAKTCSPGLIISDALMPVMDGFRFLSAIKQDGRLKSIPFIFYSATYKGVQDVELALSLGAEAYIFKPKDPVEFWDEVEIILQESKKKEAVTAELIEENEEYLKRYSEIVALKLEERIKELEESHQAYQTLAENLQGILYRVHVRENNRLQLFSKAIERIAGCAEKDLTPQVMCPLDRLIFPEDRNRVISEIGNAILEKRPFMLEYRIERSDGRILRMLDQGTPVYATEGDLLYIDGMISDITERKCEEESSPVTK